MLPVSPAPMPASTSRTNSSAVTRARSRSSASRLSHGPEGQSAGGRLLVAPYDSGHRDVRMGAGPFALLRAGAAERVGTDDVRVLDPAGEWRAELATAFELNRLVAVEVADAVRAGQVPVLLSGNCIGTVGVLAGLSATG